MSIVAGSTESVSVNAGEDLTNASSLIVQIQPKEGEVVSYAATLQLIDINIGICEKWYADQWVKAMVLIEKPGQYRYRLKYIQPGIINHTAWEFLNVT